MLVYGYHFFWTRCRLMARICLASTSTATWVSSTNSKYFCVIRVVDEVSASKIESDTQYSALATGLHGPFNEHSGGGRKQSPTAICGKTRSGNIAETVRMNRSPNTLAHIVIIRLLIDSQRQRRLFLVSAARREIPRA